MSLAPLSMQMTRDKTGVFFLTVTESDGTTPQNLTGSVVYFHAGGLNAQISINQDSGGGGIIITDAVGGLATLIIPVGDTASLPDTGIWQLPCELTMVLGGETFELNRGALTIYQNVGLP